ncbi:hypothetical protein K6119_08530 [Paracrocinitomix mangrovi]|uniref:hypothetical protein n=1 Tax=Paracrocinitomix mangrovi TaxID=2862509 RepID=UPI001C8D273C|nr:hypothetical protein [Paracrocinitomix mangrovi]UKN03558.1 hypothetical protein K6119_08530 [Paracrocinitomix mangrovi]
MGKGKLYILGIVLGLVACKKEPLPDLPPASPPYYSIKGNIDGNFVEMNVDQEGIHISQGVNVENGIKTYYGQLISVNDDLLLKIEFTQPEQLKSSNGINLMNNGNISYMLQQEGCLAPSFGGNLTQGNFLMIQNQQGVFEQANQLEFDEYGIYDVSFKFTDVGQNTITVPVNYGYHNNSLNSDFTASALQDSVVLTANLNEYTHDWYVDGNYIGSGFQTITTMPIGIHKVEHVIRDEYMNESSSTSLIRIIDFVFDWQMKLNQCSGGTNNQSNYGKVKVTVVKDGVEFKSENTPWNIYNGNFNVSDIEYISSNAGTPTRVVFDFYFDALLATEGETETLSLSSMSGTFNVGLQ